MLLKNIYANDIFVNVYQYLSNKNDIYVNITYKYLRKYLL